jgi:cobalt-zinc-cadmium efflux system membrane fusion protein
VIYVPLCSTLLPAGGATLRRTIGITSRRLMIFSIGCTALLASACAKGDGAAANGSAADSAGRGTESKLSGPDSGAPNSKSADVAPGAAALPTELTFTAAQVQHGGVRWAAVTMGTTNASSAAVPGQVVPNEDRTARLGAPGSGRVVNVLVQPGQRVSRNQVLVTLQSSEASIAQSDVTKATAGMTSAKAQEQYADAARARAERLLVLKAIPRQDYDRAIADDDEAHAVLAQAKSELNRATTTASQLGAGDGSPSGEFLIRSPMAGVILARTAAPGAVVDIGAPLVVVTDPSSLWLSIDAPEQFAALFRQGESLRFTVPAYPADTFAARVNAVGAGLDPDTRTLPVRGVINNGRERLKPAMLASVIVGGGNALAAALIPENAVQLVDGKPNVFLARPDSGGVKLERRVVTVGPRSNGRIAIIRGLETGDVVVVAGAFAVKAEFQKATLPKMD